MHYTQYLNTHGIRPSSQRLKVFEFLFRNRSHPTADEIFRALSPSMPRLSKTTVYNTLKLFVDQGVACIVSIEDNEVRYDADTSLHGHFKCKGCGMVFDFQVNREAFETNHLINYQIDEYHINLRGYCQVCRSTSLS